MPKTEATPEISSGGAVGSKPVQDKSGGAGVSTNALAMTLGSTPVAGNLLIAVISRAAGAGTITSITETNVVWTQVKAQSNATATTIEIWKGVVSASASATLTVNCSSTVFTGLHVSEWAGITGTLDTSASFSGAVLAGGTGLNTGVILPTKTNALVLGGFTTNSNTTKYSSVIGIYSFQGMMATPCDVAAGYVFPGKTPAIGARADGGGGTSGVGAIVSLT